MLINRFILVYLIKIPIMKLQKLIVTIALWWVGCMWIFSAKADGINTLFTPIYPQTHAVRLTRVFNHTDSITDFDHTRNINGLSVSATIVQPSSQSMVRFILIDTAGHEYLVGECSRLFNDNDTVNWVCHSEETCRLTNVHPAKLKIAVKEATVTLHGINMSESGSTTISSLSELDATTLHRQQVEQKVAAINAYNRSHNKLWLAGVTELALSPYAQKKNILGLSDEGSDMEGIEYYVGGIFEVGEASAATNEQTENSPYVDEFDWRNRHGINWITPIKHQGESGMCTSFAVAGATESLVNLYYNQKIDMDLSEVDIAYYGTGRTYKEAYNEGIWAEDILPEFLKHGISDEESIPFIDSADYNYPQERPQSIERIYVDSYDRIKHYSAYYKTLDKEDSIKKYLIKKGPLISGFTSGRTCHSMTLVGYKKLQITDSIYIANRNNYNKPDPEKDKRIGKTYWVFKNSYGVGTYGTLKDGYFYMMFIEDNVMFNPYYLNTPIRSQNYTDSDIQCTDRDGDGYFFWGIGPRPNNLPSWAQSEPDGDDSDYSKGPMNEYGYCLDINPNENDTLYITNHTTWKKRQYLYQHVVICENTSLTVNDTTTFYKGCSLTIRKGGSLVVDGGSLDNIILKAAETASILIKNEGVINYNKEEELEIPLNSELEIYNGTLQVKE